MLWSRCIQHGINIKGSPWYVTTMQYAQLSIRIIKLFSKCLVLQMFYKFMRNHKRPMPYAHICICSHNYQYRFPSYTGYFCDKTNTCAMLNCTCEV